MNLSMIGRISAMAISALVITGSVMAAEPIDPAAGRWTEQRANKWAEKQPWLFGFNYVPSTAVNDTEMWNKDTFDPATIDRELGWAKGLGYNSCRVFLQYIVWKEDAKGFKKRFNQFLELADKHKISVMPIFFDDCAFDASRDPYPGKQEDPIPGTSNARWVPSPGLKLVTDKTVWNDLEKYIKDMVGTYKNDKRILLWDLYNEPGNSGMGNKSLPLVEATFAWARQAKPSQPLTIGVWGGPKEISDKQIELSDIVSYHFYGDYNGMKTRIEHFKTFGRPVVCTEWMARTLGAKYETELPLFRDEKVGCYNWGLVNGRTQCQYPWGSPKDAPEPEVWFHDLLRRDGSPRYPDEVAFIRKFTNAPSVNQSNLSAGQWTTQKANEWAEKQPWVMGFNFLPSTAVNDTEMWQKDTFDPATIDRELGWAQQIGYNSCRVFLQYIVWKEDPKGLKERFKQFLEIADKHKISVMPIFFDDCAFDASRDPYPGKQDEPVPGVHNSRWVPSPGYKLIADKNEWPSLENYVKDFVGSFKNDKRIVVWDIYNEPNNNDHIPLLEATFAWARQMKPSQPLTVGVWGGPREISERQLELSDITSYHAYTDYNGMKGRIADLKKLNRPVICTEWMARTVGSKIETELPLFRDENVGCYQWGLVAGRTQTYYPWGSPKGAPEPAKWHHDILRRDGSPRYPEEVAFMRKFRGAPGVTQLKPLFDFPVRDTCVCVGKDAYYLIGTTGAPTWWQTNEGIRMWKSKDLKDWQPMGLVWSFEKNMTWQKKQGENQAIWAPEMHYIKGNYYITYCANYQGTGILKSTSGKPEGPYADIKPDGPLTGEIDASLFQDDDGKVYFVYQNGKIARMKNDMSGLAEEPKLLKPANAQQVGFEGAFIFKANGRYYLSCADFIDGRYHCYVASSKSLMGPYGDRYLAVPHGGHNMFFKDKKGNWWSTFFGNDGDAPFTERPAILRIDFGLDGEPRPMP